MLLLSFYISNERYVIETGDVIEVVPMVTLKNIPGAEKMVTGMLNYHGQVVPVIDINALCNGNAVKRSLTSRIILVKYMDNRTLGLLAENVTETLHIDDSEFNEVGIKVSNYDFLGGIAEHNDTLLQLINVDQLLSESLQKVLFSDEKQYGTV
jgi:chemotaxis-related protein WspB